MTSKGVALSGAVKPHVSLFFCEDFRIEVGDKPFVVGLLSPVVYTDGEDGQDDAFNLVTYALFPAGVQSAHLRLIITINVPGRDPEVRKYSRRIKQDQQAEEGEAWAAWLPLVVEVSGCRDKTRIGATLKTEHGETWASVLLRLKSADSDE